MPSEDSSPFTADDMFTAGAILARARQAGGLLRSCYRLGDVITDEDIEQLQLAARLTHHVIQDVDARLAQFDGSAELPHEVSP